MASRRSGRGLAVVATVTRPVRVAIYVRVSTDDQANKEFSSIEAQIQAAKAYVASQRNEGWTLLPEVYSDPGFSGANTNRPGFRRLEADIEAGLIDIVVVYKFDRLSRSMLDFLQILAFFKRRNVSFVSVSQRFDTSTPVGEMTLNVLLSFSQFERQIIAERTRDKMHAARRHGRWTGGPPPLGYDVAPEGGRLVINKDEADQVRAIFDLYVEKESLLPVVQKLARRGWRRKTWTTRDGKLHVGRPFNKVDLHRLLVDPLYIGKQKLVGEVFPGLHPAIVSKATFERVQRILDHNCRNRGAGSRNRHGALLRGILRCAACDAAMVHAFTQERRGKTFRYYRCRHAIKNGAGACPTGSVPAVKIEGVVYEQIKRIGSDPVLCEETFRQVQEQVAAERKSLTAESKRIDRDFAAVRDEVERLTTAIERTSGAAMDALVTKLGASQERVVQLERRRREVAQRLEALAVKGSTAEEVGRTLAQFTEVWDVLLTPERERVVRLLIDRVDYNGAQLKFTFSPTGAKLLTAEVAS